MKRLSLLLGILIPGLALAQAYKVPRTPQGQPDLQGIWQAMSTATAVNIEPHSAAMNMQAGIGVIVEPGDGRLPYRPEARARQQENFKNRAALDTMNKCYLPGVPRVTYLPFPFQILQTSKTVIMLSEYTHTTRNIFLNDKHLDGLELWMGDARGSWDGDTLVVDTTQFNGETWFDQSGNHHSAQMHVVERFQRTGQDVLTYEATITDPATFTRPWTMRLLLYRQQDSNYRLLEYECQAYLEGLQ